MEVIFVVLQGLGQVFRCRRQDDRGFFAHGNIRFSSEVTDSLDSFHEGIHGSGIVGKIPFILSLRPGSDDDAFPFVRQMLPEVFRNEGHEGMEHFQGMGQNVDQNVLDGVLVAVAGGLVEALLGKLDLPVAVGAPN